jgi:hypothetical protein
MQNEVNAEITNEIEKSNQPDDEIIERELSAFINELEGNLLIDSNVQVE